MKLFAVWNKDCAKDATRFVLVQADHPEAVQATIPAGFAADRVEEVQAFNTLAEYVFYRATFDALTRTKGIGILTDAAVADLEANAQRRVAKVAPQDLVHVVGRMSRSITPGTPYVLTGIEGVFTNYTGAHRLNDRHDFRCSQKLTRVFTGVSDALAYHAGPAYAQDAAREKELNQTMPPEKRAELRI